jgi:hypothetical protein
VSALAPRPCVGCGEAFAPARRAQTFCAKVECRRARNRAKASACRARATTTPLLLSQYRQEVFNARRSGAIDEHEAIELLVTPSRRVLRMLAERVAV